jgi:hypothetical protein
MADENINFLTILSLLPNLIRSVLHVIQEEMQSEQRGLVKHIDHMRAVEPSRHADRETFSREFVGQSDQPLAAGHRLRASAKS